MKRHMHIAQEHFKIAGHFTIARGSRSHASVVSVTLEENGVTGRGECVPYARYGESLDSVYAEIETLRAALEDGLDRHELQNRIKAGAARNSIDCALWDLEAKLRNISVADLAGSPMLKPVTTAYTISLDRPEIMAEAAAKASHRPVLKIKLGAPEGDMERIKAVRLAAPNSLLIADANEGWTTDNLGTHLKACAGAGFSLIEQPLPADQDAFLAGFDSPVPLCADESLHDRHDLARIATLYDVINIKLDKTGGLTEALALAEEARAYDLEIMIGCMVGTSLAMAPAFLLTPYARFVDLDGPLLLNEDRKNAIVYENSLMHPPHRNLWG
jgi:L-Ala-D/L-Glu epimerase